MKFKNGKILLDLCTEYNENISGIMLRREIDEKNTDIESIYSMLDKAIDIMINSVEDGIKNTRNSLGGLIGGESKLIYESLGSNAHNLSDDVLKVASYAMGVMEINALMGIVVAAPTAGSCGVLPAVLKHSIDKFGYSREKIREGVLCASAIGLLVTNNASVSGAEGGCQAEVGTATAMSAAALVEMMGGSPQMCLDAASFSFKNVMGLVCDPIAGLVEKPCANRNALGAINALLCADMAMLGMKSIIPFDEVVEAMYQVGNMMSPDLKETARGGIAACPCAKAIEHKIFG